VQDFTFLTTKQESMANEPQPQTKKAPTAPKGSSSDRAKPKSSMATSEQDDDLPF
jgi:single-stranded DNA-binding protein